MDRARKKKGKGKGRDASKAEAEKAGPGASKKKGKGGKDKAPLGPFYGAPPLTGGLRKPGPSEAPAGKEPGGRKSTSEPAHTPAPAPGASGPIHARPLQAKLAVGEAGDAYEREADAVGDRVAARMAAPAISPLQPGALAPVQREAKAERKVPEKPAEAVPKEGVEEEAHDEDEEEEEEEGPTGLTAKDAKGAQVVQHMSRSETAVQREENPAAKETEKNKPKTPAASGSPSAATPSPAPKKETPKEKPPEKDKSGTPVQKKAAGEDEKKPEGESTAHADPVQANRNTGVSSPVPSHAVAEQAIGNKGPGEPLKPTTRGALESSLGMDLGQVRVHEGGAAQEAADSINAKAFTHGNDIWLGKGASQDDLRLMGHEAAHTVQQAGGVHRMVQRTGGNQDPLDKVFSDPDGVGTLNEDTKVVTIPEIKIPSVHGAIKGATGKPEPVEQDKELKIPAWNGRPETSEIAQWENAVSANVRSKLTTKLNGCPPMVLDNNPAYYLKMKGAQTYFIGTKEAILPKLLRPIWREDGTPNTFGFDVDHKREMQLGGVDKPDNYELLDASANRSSGSRISRQINQKVNNLLNAAVAARKVFRTNPTPGVFRQTHEITFQKVKPMTEVDLVPGANGDGKSYWSLEKMISGDHLNGLDVLNAAQISALGLRGASNKLVIFSRPSGGAKTEVGWTGQESGTKNDYRPNEELFPKLKLLSVTYSKPTGGTVKVRAFENRRGVDRVDVDLNLVSMPGVEWGGAIDDRNLGPAIAYRLRASEWSPVRIDDAEIDGSRGFVLRGKVLADHIPIFRSPLEFDLEIEGDAIRITKTFDTGVFNFPGPIRITGSSVTLALGTDGAGMSGLVNFEIQGVGAGQLTASGSSKEGLAIEGSFDFASDLFDRATVHLGYRNRRFHGSGELAINEGKIRGVRSATGNVRYEEGVLSANGNIQLSIPGVQSADVAIRYSETEGVSVDGRFELGGIPGIRSGGGTVQLRKPAGAEAWAVNATGTAIPSIPGIESSIGIRYEEGALTVEGSAAFNRGMLSGNINVGATNRPVGADGRPAGAPGQSFIVYGGGSATLRISPWLQATATIVIRPNGEMQVTGDIGLPSAINLFEEKRREREILRIGLDIPIVGLAVAGQRIGIFATIQGGLALNAGIGPGQLKDLNLRVSYNPSHEDQTTVTGRGSFQIPAHAGMRLFVRGGLGAGIPIVSATAGLEIGGELGLEGALTADAVINWTPTRGLVLDARGGLHAEPKFKFSVAGYVDVSADLLATTIELYHKQWRLAEMEYGSGLRLGMTMPIHFEEGRPFNPSLDDIQFEVPHVDPMGVLSGLIHRIA